jgi:hypothetical protein
VGNDHRTLIQFYSDQPRAGWQTDIKSAAVGALIEGHAQSVEPRLCVCRLEQLDQRTANDNLAADHIRAFDVKSTHLLINELQREVV